jgi:hypothetical protein
MTVPGNSYRHHTHRLDLDDPSIREWTATVLFADLDRGIVLVRDPDAGCSAWPRQVFGDEWCHETI